MLTKRQIDKFENMVEDFIYDVEPEDWQEVDSVLYDMSSIVESVVLEYADSHDIHQCRFDYDDFRDYYFQEGFYD